MEKDPQKEEGNQKVGKRGKRVTTVEKWDISGEIVGQKAKEKEKVREDKTTSSTITNHERVKARLQGGTSPALVVMAGVKVVEIGEVVMQMAGVEASRKTKITNSKLKSSHNRTKGEK